MKQVKSSLLIIALFFVSQIAKAQNDTKSYDLTEFDKVQIENINGEVEIELGKPYSITISGKDNAQEQVQISKSEGNLLIKLDNKFIVDWKQRKIVKVKITLPVISKLYNFSNADVNINNFNGRTLEIENNGNGNLLLTGTNVDYIELKNNGNGNLETKNIISKIATISKSGNGDVTIKTDSEFNVEMDGNGDVVNYGKGNAIIKKQNGTGKVLNRN